MARQVVCDSSSVVAMLLDSGPDGRWAGDWMRDAELFAPHLLAFEATNVVRRLELAGIVSADQAAQAHADLRDLYISYWPYELLAERAWQLRKNLTLYDASYVALAELIGAPLLTLDQAIAGSPGIRCNVATPRGPSRS